MAGRIDEEERARMEKRFEKFKPRHEATENNLQVRQNISGVVSLELRVT